MQSLKRLLADMSDAQGPTLSELISIYDLPEQVAWLQDVLADTGQEVPALQPDPPSALTAAVLARIEVSLAQADLACFARWRPVYRLPAADTPPGPFVLAWEERSFATAELGASLCPGYALAADPWLDRRLSRTMDRRMLSLLGGSGELTGVAGLGLHLNVATLLCPAFLRFDERLPPGLRGSVVVSLQAADVMADGSAFSFARAFTRARGYRLLLAGAGAALLEALNVTAAGFDFVRSSLRDAPALLPAGVQLVVTRVERPGDLEQARLLGAGFVSGPGIQTRPGALPSDRLAFA